MFYRAPKGLRGLFIWQEMSHPEAHPVDFNFILWLFQSKHRNDCLRSILCLIPSWFFLLRSNNKHIQECLACRADNWAPVRCLMIPDWCPASGYSGQWHATTFSVYVSSPPEISPFAWVFIDTTWENEWLIKQSCLLNPNSMGFHVHSVAQSISYFN